MNPYLFKQIDEWEWVFLTDAGLKYGVFCEDQSRQWADVLPNGIRICEISLLPSSPSQNADPRIRPTVEAILAELWNRSDTILLFRFDATDAKQHARRRLFRRWFEQLSDDWKSVSWHELESSIGTRATPIALLIDDKLPEGEEIRYWLEAYVRYLEEQ